MTARRSALALIALTLAGIVSPPVPMRPSAWAEANFVLPDGDLKGQLIKLAQTPHLIEPLDATGPDDIDNEIAVMKCAQSAFTTMLQMSIGHSIDRDPCDMMVVQPTDSALTDFNSQKLGRAIEGSPILLRKVRPQVGRSGTASTIYEKKFPGGALFLALATSSADLRSKTIKKAFCDEIDEYPDDLNDQGDPLDMIKARQISFLRPGTWKRVYISTPTIKGSSKIEAKFEGGDQRHWTMTCPHCGDTRLAWRAASGRGRIHTFVINHKAPKGWSGPVPYVIAVVLVFATLGAIFRTGTYVYATTGKAPEAISQDLVALHASSSFTFAARSRVENGLVT